MLENLIIYYIVFIITLSLIKFKYEKIGLLFLSIFSGLRTNVGTDFQAYIQIYYEGIKEKGIFGIGFDEYGFLFLTKISVILGSYRWMFLLSSILILFFMFYGIKKINKKNYILIFSFFLFLYYPMSFNTVRQGIAQSILIYGLYYLFEKKLIKFLLTMLLAMSFHKFSMVILPIYFIYNSRKQINKKILKYFFIMTVIMIVFFYKNIIISISNINNKLSRYINYVIIESKEKNRDFYLKILELLGLSLFYKKLVNKDKKNQLYMYTFIISLMFNFLGFYNIFIKRIGIYYEIYMIFLLSIIPEIFKKTQRKYIKLVLHLFTVLYFYVIYIFLKHGDIYSYKFL